MSDTLLQALWLTLIGMGMTFLSIGALVGGIFLLTHLTRTRRSEPASLPNKATSSGEEIYGAPASAVAQPALGEDVGYRRRAVAVAVVAALALAEGERKVPPLVSSGSGWDAFVRGRQLSSRANYESRRRNASRSGCEITDSRR